MSQQKQQNQIFLKTSNNLNIKYMPKNEHFQVIIEIKTFKNMSKE